MYEHHFKNIMKRENINWKILTNDLRPLMDIRFEVSEPQEKLFNEEYSLNKPINMEALCEDTQFKNVIVRNLNFMLLRLRWQKGALDDLKQLINEVEIEIKQLNIE